MKNQIRRASFRSGVGWPCGAISIHAKKEDNIHDDHGESLEQHCSFWFIVQVVDLWSESIKGKKSSIHQASCYQNRQQTWRGSIRTKQRMVDSPMSKWKCPSKQKIKVRSFILGILHNTIFRAADYEWWPASFCGPRNLCCGKRESTKSW